MKSIVSVTTLAALIAAAPSALCDPEVARAEEHTAEAESLLEARPVRLQSAGRGDCLEAIAPNRVETTRCVPERSAQWWSLYPVITVTGLEYALMSNGFVVPLCLETDRRLQTVTALYACTSAPSQRWLVEPVYDEWGSFSGYHVVQARTRLCLEASAAGQRRAMVQRPCNPADPYQIWRID